MARGPAPKCSDEEFIQLFPSMSVTNLARKLGVTDRNVYDRRRNLEERYAISIPANRDENPNEIKSAFPGRVEIEVKNGRVLIGSDFHIWPGAESTCLRAFKKFVTDLKPSVVILNGDVMDFPKISRHPQNWETAPDPLQEIEAAQDHLNDIVQRCPRGAQKIWTIGNHDRRFEHLIANALPQLKGIKGIHLSDHFAVWQKAMSCMINFDIESSRTMVKHRLKGGKHATFNNVKEAGTHIITGHLHAQNVRSVSDYRGFDLYGFDTGCVADRDHRAFSYHEDAPVDWRSGFGLLTYRDGRLMVPEMVTKWSADSVTFRGEIIRA
jgi:hypothetical protein